MREHEKGGALTEVSFFVLLALYQPRHGYGIMQFVEEKTQGRLVLGAGTLYGALSTLEKKGWISRHNANEDRKKEYQITREGKEMVEKERRRLHSLLELARRVMEEESK